jgi:cytochrome c-type biogenesis protein CcmH/NrfG
MASGDIGEAVVAFNKALSLDPGNAEAKEGFADAAERYKAGKAVREAMDNIRLAFRDGEFTSGLRLAYRLPPSVDKAYADEVKVTGWYNLAVVALRAGDCAGALSNLKEALSIAPEDSEAKTLRDFASRYAESVKDRAFLNRVEALSFRPLPSS